MHVTYASLVAQSQCVKGADCEKVAIRTPRDARDGVVVRGTAVHQTTVAVPDLTHILGIF